MIPLTPARVESRDTQIPVHTLQIHSNLSLQGNHSGLLCTPTGSVFGRSAALVQILERHLCGNRRYYCIEKQLGHLGHLLKTLVTSIYLSFHMRQGL